MTGATAGLLPLLLLAAAGTGTDVEAGGDAEAEAEPAAVPVRTAQPLVLLVQGDAVAGEEVAEVPPASGPALRLRRLRAGDDLASGSLRVRAVLEAQPSDQPWTPLEGGVIAGGAVRLSEAFAAWTPHRGFQVVAGAQRVPFSLSRQIDEPDLRLPERAQILNAATPDYRTGLALAGDLGLLQYRAAFLSAATSVGGALLDARGLFAFRLAAEPIGPMGLTPWRRGPDDPWYGWWRFSAGVSVLYGTLQAPGTLRLGADGQLQVRRFTAAAEYVFVDGPARQQGVVVEPGFTVAPQRLDLALRAAWSRLGSADTTAAGAGVTFLMRAGHLRWQAAFERRVSEGAPSGWAILRATLVL
jgi:hypothetical protein